MMRSLYSGVAGLKTHQTGMDVVGNNIANVNTIGFKSFRATYADTVYQTSQGASAPDGETRGGTNPMQVGLGVGVASIDKMFKDGSVQTTSRNTDLCLSGDGLFIVESGSGTYYTRNGAFEFDGEGNYVNSAGMYVQGWMAEDGVLNINPSKTEIIKIESGKSLDPKATTMAQFRNNLNSKEPTILSMADQDGNALTGTATVPDAAATPPITAITLTMSDGTTKTVTSGTYTEGNSIPITTTIVVYDSQGGEHIIPLTIEKDASNAVNQWKCSLAANADPSIDSYSLTSGGTITFNSDGSFDAGSASLEIEYNSTVTAPPTPGVTGVASPQTIAIDFSSLTQFASSNTVKNEADGYEAGTLVEVNIDSSGVITGTYTNGRNQIEAQVAIAQFNNPGGLTVKGGSLYQKSNNSGEPSVYPAPNLGVTITGSALEMSNVDLAQEFSTMIVTQRGFQSNSKIITVSDEMLEILANLKR